MRLEHLDGFCNYEPRNLKPEPARAQPNDLLYPKDTIVRPQLIIHAKQWGTLLERSDIKS
jgi:hypothetical protein